MQATEKNKEIQEEETAMEVVIEKESTKKLDKGDEVMFGLSEVA